MAYRRRSFRPQGAPGRGQHPDRAAAGLVAVLFWIGGAALLCAPFLRPRAAADSEGGDWGRELSEVDIPFAEDVAYFQQDYELPLGELISEQSAARFGLGSQGLAELGIVDQARVRAGERQYRLHCVGCHGSSGDGAGPGARYLNPRPRNFRHGKFKFTSTDTGSRPRRTDLFGTITRGLGGSSMPEFRLLSEERRWDLVEYVRWVAMRGEFEQMMLDWAWSDEELPDPDEVAEVVLERWSEEHTRAVYPGSPETDYTPQSVAHGRQLYLDAAGANCVSCHGESGQGDGPSASDLPDEWGYPIAPRDLTTGSFRAGNESADLYRSIATGVNGTPMPSFGSSFEPEEIWDLVHFVQSLSREEVSGE